MFVILLGPPGAGKGTQARLLADRLGVPTVSTGDLFREEMAKASALGNTVGDFINRGDLVPDEITLQVLGERLKQPDASRGAVFDGFPRTVAQAQALERILEKRSGRLTSVVDFEVEESELLRRLAGRWTCRNCHATYHETAAPPREVGVCDRCGGELYQREDDTDEAVRVRLAVYRERTAPLVDYYQRAHVLRRIDASQSREDVTKSLLGALDGSTPRG